MVQPADAKEEAMNARSRHVRQAVAPVESKHAGIWITLAVLGMFLVLALAFSYVGWTSSSDATEHQMQQMSTSGYVAMTLGIVATLALGVGLMTLVFYSNRKGHDEDANADRNR
jgi:hypothetical protein